MAAQVTSHLVCCVSEHLHWDAGQPGQLGKSIASLMDRSWARNLQSPPRNHSLSLSVVPYCAQTHNEEHFGLFHFHVGGEEALSQWKQQSFLRPLAVTICMIVLVCLSNTTIFFTKFRHQSMENCRVFKLQNQTVRLASVVNLLTRNQSSLIPFVF